MFLDWISVQGLLQHDPAQNILGHFPLEVRRSVVRSIVNYLDTAIDTSFLATAAHVAFMMEVIGQGMALPIADADVIEKCIDLYVEWLKCLWFPNEGIPQSIRADPLCYTRIMLQHYSLLFIPRGDKLVKQVNMCSRAIDSIQAVVHNGAQALDPTTNDTILRLLIGITDSLVSQPPEGLEASSIPTPVVNASDPAFNTPNVALSQASLEVNRSMQNIIGNQARLGQDNGPALADALTSSLLQALFDTVLFCCATSFPTPALWYELKQRIPRWWHRVSFIETWNATMLALTNRMIRLLYGPEYGSATVTVEYAEKRKAYFNDNINIPDDCVIQAWFRLMHAIENPNLIEDTKIYLLAMRGVSRIVDAFLQVGTKPTSPSVTTRPPRATGNSILHLLGQWLVEACVTKTDRFAKGRAEAYASLCRIFTAPQYVNEHRQVRDAFQTVYLARFYRALCQGLQQEPLSMTAIILNTTQIFSLDLKGVRVMVPHYIAAISLVLNDSTPIVPIFHETTTPLLRRAGLEILMTLMNQLNHFAACPIRACHWKPDLRSTSPINNNLGPLQGFKSRRMSDTDQLANMHSLVRKTISSPLRNKNQRLSAFVDGIEGTGDKQTFSDLEPSLSGLLFGTLNIITDPVNWQVLLYSMCAWAFEMMPTRKTAGATVCRSISTRLVKLQWPTDVSLAALDVLSSLSTLHRNIDQEEKGNSSNTVFALCSYIDRLHSEEKPRHTRLLHSLIVSAYHCMIKWIMADQWLMLASNQKCLACVIQTIELGMTGMISRKVPFVKGEHFSRVFNPDGGIPKEIKTANPASKRVKEAAEMVLLQLLNQLGSFPAPCGPSSTSTLVDEQTALRLILKKAEEEKMQHEVNNADSLVRYFSVDGQTILSIIEQPGLSAEGPAVTLICRDAGGRYSWNASMLYLSREQRSTMISQRPAPIARPDPDLNVGKNYIGVDSSAFMPLPGECGSLTNDPFEIQGPAFVDDVPHVSQLTKSATLQKTQSVFASYTAKQIDVEKVVHEKVRTERNQAPFPDPQTGIEEPAPCDLYGHACKFQAGRLFASSLGLLSLESLKPDVDANGQSASRPRVVELKVNASFVRALEAIDQTRERECNTHPVYYVSQNQYSAESIINNPIQNDDFKTFLHSLGWPVDLSKHIGYRDGLHAGSAPYYAESSVEVLFVVPCLVEADPAVVASVLLSATGMIIVWLEDISDLPNFPESLHGNKPVLFIAPTAWGTYRIRIKNCETGRAIIGPLVDGMVVSRHALGPLVRETCIGQTRRSRLDDDTHTRAHVNRRRKLEELTQKYMKTGSSASFLADIFAGSVSDNSELVSASSVSPMPPPPPPKLASVLEHSSSV